MLQSLLKPEPDSLLPFYFYLFTFLMIKLIKYTAEYKLQWDDLIRKSKNGTFILLRDYLEYHSDRFEDHSLLFLQKGKVIAVLPGNVSEGKYYSHQGLTYGGLITSPETKTRDVLDIFRLIISYCKSMGIYEIIYKPSPYIYHSAPSQEDLYALFKFGAEKTDSKISSVIYQTNRLGFRESRNGGIRKSKQNKIVIKESESYDSFWEILNKNLWEKYATKPVHTLNEILLLKTRFPENIKLYTAEINNEIIAGVLLYLNPGCVHVQYISSNTDGRKMGALDLLFDDLLNSIYTTVPVFDFGTSNGSIGQILVEELLFQKEGFGGRGVVYETYRLVL